MLHLQTSWTSIAEIENCLLCQHLHKVTKPLVLFFALLVFSSEFSFLFSLFLLLVKQNLISSAHISPSIMRTAPAKTFFNSGICLCFRASKGTRVIRHSGECKGFSLGSAIPLTWTITHCWIYRDAERLSYLESQFISFHFSSICSFP